MHMDSLSRDRMSRSCHAARASGSGALRDPKNRCLALVYHALSGRRPARLPHFVLHRYLCATWINHRMNKKMPTIALVDDDRNILTSVGMTLESEGYQVQKYTDGAAALQGLQDTPPDMAIFDIKMPRMDGMELLRRIRQKSDLPVIFLTSKDDEIDELFGLKMGADDFIRKPFSQRLLVERVKAVMRRASAREAAAK